MKIKEIKIKQFRHLKDITINLGSSLTAIAGQNGTGKSSVLGLIGHVFSYRDSTGIVKNKTIDNKPFETLFSEIFSFSYPKYDKPGNHSYEVFFDNNTSIQVLSSERAVRGNTKQLRLNVGRKTTGGGKRNLPVIYLGLRRLFPLAQERRINSKASNLTQEEIQEYQTLHNEILILNEAINPEFVATFSKTFYAVKTTKYDSLGNSAGQDNIGQIITAILSFQRLKNELGSNYQGGILLIDELDATLFSGAQEKLLNRLLKVSHDLDLQIIFTTHSLEILEQLTLPQYKRHTRIVFLDNSSGIVKNEQDNVTLGKIINNLKVLLPVLEKTAKTFIFCEDNEAGLWLKNLVGGKNSGKIRIIQDTFGAGNLIDIANKNIPFFKQCIFLLDGDQGKALKNNKCPRVILLPGAERPENIFYNYLRQLPANDQFWGKTGEYTQQVCFKDQPTIGDRVQMKRWFKQQAPYWGNGCNRLFKRWKNDNPKLAEDFKESFESTLSQITRIK